MSKSPFSKKYKELEKRFRQQARAEGNVYLPNVPPKAKVDYVFIAMEPSFGGWASSIDNACKKVRNGFRNFVNSFEDYLLHYSIREYLCQDDQTYHVTDFSKGAMFVEKANQEREKRYRVWYQLLMDELKLIQKPNSIVFGIGKSVEKSLKQHDFDDLSAILLHYSPQAARWRKKCIEGEEDRFEILSKSVSIDDIIRTATEVLTETDMPETMQQKTLDRVKQSKLTHSRKMLLFCYKSTFANWR